MFIKRNPPPSHGVGWNVKTKTNKQTNTKGNVYTDADFSLVLANYRLVQKTVIHYFDENSLQFIFISKLMLIICFLFFYFRHPKRGTYARHVKT